jgi:lipopolysaccharide export LptBFGC system permease protein LptF
MHACGLSPTRSVAAIIALIVLAMPLQLALDEGLVPRTNRLADEIKESRIKRSTEHGARALWYREGDRILRAETLDASIGHAEGLTVYQLGDDGRPVSRIDARTARHVGDGRWQLEGAVAVRIGDHGPERIPAPDIVVLGAGQPEPLDPTHLDSWTLAREIDALAARGFDVTTHRVDLLHRFVAPLACLLLPLIGLLIAGTGPPFPTPASALLACAAVGVGHQLVVALATSLGYGKAFGPAIAALLPMLATATLGGALLLRARR